MVFKTHKILSIFILIFSILLLISNPFTPGFCPTYNGEIMCEVIGLSSEYANSTWTVTASSLSSTRWWYVHADYEFPITSGYSSASVSGTGNTYCLIGFSAPHSPDAQHDLAYGEYEFTFDLPGPYSSHSFDLDLRDGDWSTEYNPRDVWIRCHITSTSSAYFEWKHGQGGTYSSNMKDTIWEMAGRTANKDVLQPTKPRNFECENELQRGANPYFSWDPPLQPTGTTFTYYIYRDLGAGFTNIGSTTSTGYTDTGIEITNPGINTAYYYATAKGSDSSCLESEASDIETVNTNTAEKKLAEKEPQVMFDKNNPANVPLLSSFPNPFNPTTNISYHVPKTGYVQLCIYNVAGQIIDELVNDFKYPGEYSQKFNGQSLAGGIFLIHLQVNDQHITKKILLFK